MNKLEVCIEEAKQMFWFLTFDEKTINYTIKMVKEYSDLHEGLIILNGKHVIPEEMTTNTLFVIQNAISMIKQNQAVAFHSTTSDVKPNEQEIKAINYLEKTLEIANSYDDEIEVVEHNIKR